MNVSDSIADMKATRKGILAAVTDDKTENVCKMIFPPGGKTQEQKCGL